MLARWQWRSGARRRKAGSGIIFVIQTTAVFWLLGYVAGWYTFRRTQVWRVVIPIGIVLLSVVYYYSGPKPLLVYLAIYTLLALVFVAITYLSGEERRWRNEAVRYDRAIQFDFLRAKNLWLDIFTGGASAIDRTLDLQLGVEVFARRAGGSDDSRRTDRLGDTGIFYFERNANAGDTVRRGVDPCGNLSRFATNKSKLNRKARQGCKDDQTQKHEPHSRTNTYNHFYRDL